jgi:hypothetical protein
VALQESQNQEADGLGQDVQAAHLDHAADCGSICTRKAGIFCSVGMGLEP